MEKNTLLSSFTWLMGVAQLIGGLLCQKYGGKVVFGFSNFSLGFLNFLIPAASKVGVKTVIAVRVLQGMTGVSCNQTKYRLRNFKLTVTNRPSVKFYAIFFNNCLNLDFCHILLLFFFFLQSFAKPLNHSIFFIFLLILMALFAQTYAENDPVFLFLIN